MNKLEELTAILFECESVKKDVTELREGCKIWVYVFATDSYVYWTMTWPIRFNIDSDVYEVKDYPLHKNLQKREYENMEWYDKWYIKIIWNPIQDHHLRIYCVENGINLITNSYWEMATPDKSVIIELDMKPLSEQSDETLKKIINFLKDKLWTHSKVKQ